MRTTDLIAATRDGKDIPAKDLDQFARAVTSGGVPDYQVAAWLMAAYMKGLSVGGTLALTLAMRDSGRVIQWKEGPPLADKHSTGGVGDKISLILAPLAACCGLRIPMISGRSLGHTGGTLDKLESIPGMNVQITLEEFVRLVEENGVAMSGQTADLAPADRKLYALRDATSTVTSIPLICASILSKKLAENTDVLVFDVKTGNGAFMSEEHMARDLAERLTGIAREAGLRAGAVISSMDYPLGMKVGNALEVQESMDVLRGGGPVDVRELTVVLATRMLCMAMPDDFDGPAARKLCTDRLDDGSAFERFVAMVESQGGDLHAFEKLPAAPVISEVTASRSGVWAGVDAYQLGETVRGLGGGRYRMDQPIRPEVGWEQVTTGGSRVASGDILGLVHASTEADAVQAVRRIRDSSCWDCEAQPLVRGEI